MSTTGAARKPVVAGVDGSEHALRAVRWAAREAAQRHTDLDLVNAIGLPDLMAGGSMPLSSQLLAELRRRANAMLRAGSDIAASVAQVRVHVRIDDELPSRALLQASETAEILAIGSAGIGGFARSALLGSSAVAVAAHAHCPVVVVRGRQTMERDPVVVGIDGSALSDSALAMAFEEADLRHAPLIAVHVWQDSDNDVLFSQVRQEFDWEPVRAAEERVLAERLAGWAEKYPDVTTERVIGQNDPRSVLLELSEQAQLVVVGSRGRGGFRGLLLGSVSQTLLHRAACPVMIVRNVQHSVLR